jgi:hypothetical protein
MEAMTQEQQANYMLRALENQRNAAQNECVQLAAQIMALQREVAALKARMAEPDEAADEPPLANNGLGKPAPTTRTDPT